MQLFPLRISSGQLKRWPLLGVVQSLMQGTDDHRLVPGEKGGLSSFAVQNSINNTTSGEPQSVHFPSSYRFPRAIYFSEPSLCVPATELT